MKKQEGFTLIELMVVLVISNITKVACEANVRNLRITQEIYYFKNQEYANSIEIVDLLQNVEDMNEFKCPATGQNYIIEKNDGSVICEGCND